MRGLPASFEDFAAPLNLTAIADPRERFYTAQAHYWALWHGIYLAFVNLYQTALDTAAQQAGNLSYDTMFGASLGVEMVCSYPRSIQAQIPQGNGLLQYAFATPIVVPKNRNSLQVVCDYCVRMMERTIRRRVKQTFQPVGPQDQDDELVQHIQSRSDALAVPLLFGLRPFEKIPVEIRITVLQLHTPSRTIARACANRLLGMSLFMQRSYGYTFQGRVEPDRALRSIDIFDDRDIDGDA